MGSTDRVEVIVVAGGITLAAAAGADQVLARLRAEPGTATVEYDLTRVGDGVVIRTLQLSTRTERTERPLMHGCVSCSLREDVQATLRRLACRPDVRRIALRLDPVLEPEHVCWSVNHDVVGDAPVTDAVELRGVVTVLDPRTWLDDIGSDLDVADTELAALPDEDRTLAQVVVGQAEFADIIVLTGTAEPRLHAVLDRLNPSALRLDLSEVDRRVLLDDLPTNARRGVPDDPHAPLLRGEPPLHADGDVQLTLFTARRPFHPARLHDALDMLLTGVVRARGRIWLATRPDTALWIESAGGGVQVGYTGDWLATLDLADPQLWRDIDPERMASASLRWHPRWGDRTQELTILAAGADPAEIDTALREALMTDHELSLGEPAWRLLEDPFGWWQSDPCSDGDPATAADHGTRNSGHE